MNQGETRATTTVISPSIYMETTVSDLSMGEREERRQEGELTMKIQAHPPLPPMPPMWEMAQARIPPKAPARVADEKKMAMRRLAMKAKDGVSTGKEEASDKRRGRKSVVHALHSDAVKASGLTFVALVPTDEVVADTREKRTLRETEAKSCGDEASERGAETHEGHDDTL